MLIANIILGAFIGAALGSFLSASCWRLPRGISLRQPSKCDSCGANIKPWRNIPVITWLLQGGKTKCCEARIPTSVVLIESLGVIGGALLGGLAGAIGLAVAGVVVLGSVGIASLYYRGKNTEPDEQE